MTATTLERLAITAGAAVLAAVALAVAGYAAAPHDRASERPDARALRLRGEGLELLAARAATARYHSFTHARRDGYTVENEPCVASPGGTMGIHAVNPALMADPAINPVQPEMLLYVPRENGQLRLVGVEYWRAASDQIVPIDAGDRPSLFGRTFDGPMEGHGPTMPYHYDVHVWLWSADPAGLFAMFNPSLR